MKGALTVLTVAFGGVDGLKKWADCWTKAGASCIAADNGGGVPSDVMPGARILPFTGNTGFGAGINRCAEEASSELVLITNPDTLPFQDNSLEQLIEFGSSSVLTGAATVDSSGRRVPSSGIWPTAQWVRSQVFRPAATLWRPDRFDWIQGSLILARREAFLGIGGFSGDYPLYFEDVDLFARAEVSGLSKGFCRSARFIHQEGTGSSGSSAVRLAGFHWGLSEFFRNHRPDQYAYVRRLILAKCLLRYARFLPVNRFSSRGYLHGFMSVLRREKPALPKRSRG